MSRVAKAPIDIPSGVDVKVDGQNIVVKGGKDSFEHTVHPSVKVVQEDAQLKVALTDPESSDFSMAGTTRALLNNYVTGLSKGFEKKLLLVGVGYRAQAKGQVLNLSLGFSHPVVMDIPAGITVETPSQTEILVKGADKQAVGQVAANIRAWRPPEPYKGKGVKYADEHIIRKEAKKK